MIRVFLGSLIRIRVRILLSTSKEMQENLDYYRTGTVLWLSYDFLVLTMEK
jgi:hypothetical protein